MRLVTWMDWFNQAELVPINDSRAGEIAPEVSHEDLHEAIHVVTPEGKIYRAARAFRFLGLRMPLLFPLALIMWLPGVIWLAEKFYMWVSRNRYLISKIFGCKGACAIIPARKGHDKGKG